MKSSNYGSKVFKFMVKTEHNSIHLIDNIYHLMGHMVHIYVQYANLSSWENLTQSKLN